MTEPTKDVLLVEARDLHKVFQERRLMSRQSRRVNAVSGISFSVATGGSLGLVGESGSGKTTVARMLVGSEQPTSGTLLLEGRRVVGLEETQALRRQTRIVQMVFQDPYLSLDPRQTIGGMLDEVQRVHFDRSRTTRRARTVELADAVGLGDRELTALPNALSGGQRQRAAIARALAAEPRLVVLDEAVSALDVSVQAQILNLLMDLRERFRLTFIAISHDLAVVRQLCDDLLVMYRGEAMESGPTAEVLADPQHPYTVRLLASIPSPDMLLATEVARVAELPGGCPFRSRCPLAERVCEEVPPVRITAPGHQVRCWKAKSVTADNAPFASGAEGSERVAR